MRLTSSRTWSMRIRPWKPWLSRVQDFTWLYSRVLSTKIEFSGANLYAKLIPAASIALILSCPTAKAGGAVAYVQCGDCAVGPVGVPSVSSSVTPPTSGSALFGPPRSLFSYSPAAPTAPSITSNSSATVNGGSDQKWGDPMNAELFNGKNFHARLNYYAGSGNGQTQTGVGITLSFPN
jgi:hypothetical protein